MRNKDLPHPLGRITPHWMDPGVPAVEAADHTDPFSIGCRNDKVGARHPLNDPGMSSHPSPALVMTPFTPQHTIKLVQQTTDLPCSSNSVRPPYQRAAIPPIVLFSFRRRRCDTRCTQPFIAHPHQVDRRTSGVEL